MADTVSLGGNMYGDGTYVVEFENVGSTHAPLAATITSLRAGTVRRATNFPDSLEPSARIAGLLIDRIRAAEKNERAKATREVERRVRERTGIVSEHRSRQTGTTVQVIDNRDGSEDDWPDNRWGTICVDHGGIVFFTTRAAAESYAPVPEEWCPTCQDNNDQKEVTP